MPAAGDPVYASDVLRARPTVLWDSASSALAASSADVDIPGISIAFTTETAGAEVGVVWHMQADPTGAVTTTMNSRPRITGPAAFVAASAVYATYAGSLASDQATVGNNYKFTLGIAGTYTLTLRGTTNASQQVNIYTAVTATVQEQFA
jgi:hypothetical protein